ncbi:ABC transporter permease [Nonomuraea sp. NPDC048916]|uniref:ABC transporter permease n=1 Tax=Nonomuraea sp. NPDC048916 TaxID=3154232 RepID=UPI0033FF652E
MNDPMNTGTNTSMNTSMNTGTNTGMNTGTNTGTNTGMNGVKTTAPAPRAGTGEGVVVAVARGVAAEWGKLWSVRATWWCVAGTVAVTVLAALTLGGARATDLVRDGVTARLPATEAVILAMVFAQFTLVALAMLAITSEYASGSIRGTLQATPVRGRMLAAKALVVAPTTFVTGVLAGAAGAVATYLVLSAPIFGGLVTLPAGRTAADLLRVGVFCALVSLLALGAGTATRSAAGTLTVVFMLLFGLPLLLLMSGAQPAMEVAQRLPMFAGLAFMESADNPTGGPMPYSPGEGLAWLAGWAVAALATGQAVLRRRDA